MKILNYVYTVNFLISFAILNSGCLLDPAISKIQKNYLAVKRIDNSFSTTLDTSSQRILIPDRILNIILSEIDSNSNLLEIFESNFEDDITFYTCKIKSYNLIEYQLWAFKNANSEYSKKPISIDGRWMENNEIGFNKDLRLMEKMPLQLISANDDNICKIVIRERVHNGNVYNAVVANYYALNQNMEFVRIVSIEERAFISLSGCIIERELNKEILNVYLNCSGISREHIGQVTFKLNSGDTKVEDRKVYFDEFEQMIITSSGMQEMLFLSKGYKPIY